MTDKLKPCPFCGGKATTSEFEKIENMPNGWGWVGCRPCRVFMNWSHGESGKKLAIEQWNTRKPMDRIVEQLEKWKQEADEQYEDTDSELYKMASVGKYHAYKQAIEIVKEGGKDE